VLLHGLHGGPAGIAIFVALIAARVLMRGGLGGFGGRGRRRGGWNQDRRDPRDPPDDDKPPLNM